MLVVNVCHSETIAHFYNILLLFLLFIRVLFLATCVFFFYTSLTIGIQDKKVKEKKKERK